VVILPAIAITEVMLVSPAAAPAGYSLAVLGGGVQMPVYQAPIPPAPPVAAVQVIPPAPVAIPQVTMVPPRVYPKKQDRF
jgi:hypothetical protein